MAAVNVTLLQDYSDNILDVINSVLLPLLLGVAFIVFLWGVYKYYIYGAADEASRTEGHQWVLWGLIGFAIIFSFWGLVNMATDTLNLTNDNVPEVPVL